MGAPEFWLGKNEQLMAEAAYSMHYQPGIAAIACCQCP